MIEHEKIDAIVEAASKIDTEYFIELHTLAFKVGKDLYQHEIKELETYFNDVITKELEWGMNTLLFYYDLLMESKLNDVIQQKFLEYLSTINKIDAINYVGLWSSVRLDSNYSDLVELWIVDKDDEADDDLLNDLYELQDDIMFNALAPLDNLNVVETFLYFILREYKEQERLRKINEIIF